METQTGEAIRAAENLIWAHMLDCRVKAITVTSKRASGVLFRVTLDAEHQAFVAVTTDQILDLEFRPECVAAYVIRQASDQFFAMGVFKRDEE